MRYLIPLTLLGLLASPTLASPGQELHAQNCLSCHAQAFGQDGSAIYTRGDRRVSSLAGLERQVNFCQNNLGLAWFEEEVASVSEYLNQQYYHFEQP